MFHQNKGVIGLRMDGIENAQMKNVKISNLENKSPLSTYTCGSFSGHHNGGHTVVSSRNAQDREGAMNSDVRGLSLYDGDVGIIGQNSIRSLTSFSGDVTGIDLMGDAILEFDGRANDISVEDLNAASKVTKALYKKLKKTNRSPFPNNFNLCVIDMDTTSKVIDAPDDLRQKDCKLPPQLKSNSKKNKGGKKGRGRGRGQTRTYFAAGGEEDVAYYDHFGEDNDEFYGDDGKDYGNGYWRDWANLFALFSFGWCLFGTSLMIWSCYYVRKAPNSKMIDAVTDEENAHMIEN